MMMMMVVVDDASYAGDGDYMMALMIMYMVMR
jgi:hypothetical protein